MNIFTQSFSFNSTVIIPLTCAASALGAYLQDQNLTPSSPEAQNAENVSPYWSLCKKASTIFLQLLPTLAKASLSNFSLPFKLLQVQGVLVLGAGTCYPNSQAAQLSTLAIRYLNSMHSAYAATSLSNLNFPIQTLLLTVCVGSTSVILCSTYNSFIRTPPDNTPLEEEEEVAPLV